MSNEAMIRTTSAALALLLATAVPALAQSKAEVLAGRKIAADNCAPCHATGKTGSSRRQGAPPFRILSKRYNLEELQEALVEGVTVGHKGVDMPEFQFTPDRADALIAYMKSLGK